MTHTLTFEVPIPDWAELIAQDNSVEWWAYEYKPCCSYSNWGANNGKTKYLVTTEPPTDFTQELYRIERS